RRPPAFPPRRASELVAPDPREAEVTATHYRLRVPVKAGEKETLSVVLESQGWQSYAIGNMSADMLLAYATKRGELDAGTRKVFGRLAQARREIDDIDQQIAEVTRRRQVIFQDQERVRDNLRSLSGTSDIQQKYLR